MSLHPRHRTTPPWVQALLSLTLLASTLLAAGCGDTAANRRGTSADSQQPAPSYGPPDLAAEASRVEGYAGSYEDAIGRLVLLFTRDPERALDDIYMRRPELRGVPARAQQVRYSLATLRSHTSTLTQAREELSKRGVQITQVGPDIKQNLVLVAVEARPEEALRELRREFPQIPLAVEQAPFSSF